MNLWYPLGLLLCGFVIYGAIQDDRRLRTDPDDFLLRTLRGDTWGFNLTLQAALGRLTRRLAPELGQIADPDLRQQRLAEYVVALPRKAHLLRMTLWEIRFRGVAFVVIGLLLLYDLLTRGALTSAW